MTKEESMPALRAGETLTIKERKFLKAAVETGDIKAASKAVYKWEDQGSQKLANPRIQTEFQKLMDLAGLSDKRIAEKINNLVDAEKLHGEACIPVPDNGTQLNAVKLACQLKGHLSPDNNNTTINIGNSVTQVNISGDTPQDWSGLLGTIRAQRASV